MSPKKRTRKLRALLRAGFLQPGSGCLTITIHEKTFIADLGSGGEIFFDGVKFPGPKTCLEYINQQNSLPISSNDGFQEFHFNGQPLSHYRELLSSKESASDQQEDSPSEDSSSLEPAVDLMEVPSSQQGHTQNEEQELKDVVRRSSRLRNKVGNDSNPLLDLDDEDERIPASRGRGSVKSAHLKEGVGGVRSDLFRNDEETQNALLDVLADADETWLFCNNCHKWRRSRADPSIPSPWFCELNAEKKYASCKVAQELPSFAVDRLCNEESDHFYAITSGRPALDECTEEEFERDLVGFWSFLGEHNRADMIRLQRIQCNNSTMDLFGLYCEVVKWGGMMLNESYDAAGRYTGAINFSGQIFPNLKNFTPGHRATSIGNQLLVNYRKYLYDYERIWHEQDLALFAKWSPASPPIKRHIRQKRDLGINLELEPFPFASASSIQVTDIVLVKSSLLWFQESDLTPAASNLLMLAEVVLGVEKETERNDRQKVRKLNSVETSPEEEKRVSEALNKPPSHGFKQGQLLLARDALYEDRYWPVLHCRSEDLAINIRNGHSNDEAKRLCFPYSIKELLHCMGDYLPVMVTSTGAFGWVPAMFCRPFKSDLAMLQYKEALKIPEEATDITFRRAYKEALQFSSHSPLTENKASALIQKQSLSQIRNRLLGLEMDIPTLLLGKDCFPTRELWRDRVEQTHAPGQVSFEIQALSNQIDARCFKKQSHKAVLETIVKSLDHKKKEVSISSLDRAVEILEEAMDWPKIQKLVLAKTVPKKSEKISSIPTRNVAEITEGPSDHHHHIKEPNLELAKEESTSGKKVPRVKFVASGSKRKMEDSERL